MQWVEPTEAQYEELAKLRDECPLVMVNLLKFKPDGGADAYKTYGEQFSAMMEPLGVEIVYRGKCVLTAIGEDDWDEVIVVRYRSRAAFDEMERNPAYQEAMQHRAKGIADSRLFVTKEG